MSKIFFVGPFEVPVKAYLKMMNCCEKDVLYKIKSTANSNNICISKNPGILQPKEEVEVEIILRPGIDKCGHQMVFQIISIIAPEEDYDIETIWAQTDKDNEMETFIKGLLVMPDEVKEMTVEDDESDYGDNDSEVEGE